jgi:Lipase (class 3)
MTQFSKQTAASLAQFIDYAYDMDSTPVGTAPPTPAGFPSNYTIVAYAQAQDDFWGDDSPEYYGFVAQSADASQIIVAIRGTDFIVEWLIDFEVDWTSFAVIPGSGNVEDGFYSVFSTMTFVDPNMQPFDLPGFLVKAVQSNPKTGIIIEGHSLGGPIASMLALQYAYQQPTLGAQTTVYTFAAPAPGDETFSDFYNANAPQTFRVWNILDPVPSALALFDYYQIAGDGIRLVPTVEQLEGYDFLLIICNHSLMTYQWLLDSSYPLSSICQPLLATASSRAEQRQLNIEAVKQRQAMKAAGGKSL